MDKSNKENYIAHKGGKKRNRENFYIKDIS